LNTLLSDVVLRSPADERDRMLTAQLALLTRLAESVENSALETPVPQNTKGKIIIQISRIL